MKNQNLNILDEVNKGATMGMDAISYISEKVTDNNFREVLDTEYNKYKKISQRVNDLYSNYLRNNDINTIYNNLVISLVLSLFCGELNPLKIGLMELEVRNISNKYNISVSNVNNYKELSVASLVKEKILNDLPFNIIFLDSDIEIFHYLTIEKGVEVAKLYHKISEMMKSKYKTIKNKKFSLKKYIEFYDSINYDDVMDLIYAFINMKIR